MTNLLLKRSIDLVSKKEIVTLSVCGLSSARLTTDQLKCEWNGYYTSYHQTCGKLYAKRDDYISGCMWLLSVLVFVWRTLWISPWMISRRHWQHENPFRYFRGTDSWIASVIQMVDKYDREGKEIDISEIELTHVLADDNFCATSPIGWKIKNNNLKLL
ncbi:unnamed protein product [Caenorhabditis nigoni]